MPHPKQEADEVMGLLCMVGSSSIGGVSRSLRTDPRSRQALRRATPLERVRIRVHAPRRGFAHPASGRDVRAVLEAIGAGAWYGLRVVELRQTEDFDPRTIVYGRTRTPGEIFLYEQREHEAVALRDFMRFDVLLHEIGHHVLQHRVRKIGNVRRTSDHEQFAEMFASRWKPTVQAALSSCDPPTDKRTLPSGDREHADIDESGCQLDRA